MWTVRKLQSKSVSLPAHEGRQRITQLNLFALEITLELGVTSQPLLLRGVAGRGGEREGKAAQRPEERRSSLGRKLT